MTPPTSIPAPRLIDIARLAGVSKGTVARVINHVGQGNIRVSDQTKDRILRLARELHYVPNQAARALMGKQTMKLGVLVDSQAPQCTYRALSALEEEAVNAGYRLLFGCAHNSPETLFQAYGNFIQHGIDGLACLAHDYADHLTEIRKFFQDKQRIVYLDSPGWDAPHVNVRRDLGLAQALDHLYAMGRRRVALWLWESCPCHSYRQRLDAYDQYRQNEELLIVATDVQEVRKTLLRFHADAVITGNDTMAATLIRHCILNGMSIPEDLAVIGHDNDDFSSFFLPSISTIDQQDAETGRQLFSLLMKTLHENTDCPQVDVIPNLVIRESSHPKPTTHHHASQTPP